MPVVVGVTVSEPFVACVPVQLPLAVQLVASVDDQVSVAVLPTAIDVADSARVGAGGGGAVTVSVTVVVADVPLTLLQAIA